MFASRQTKDVQVPGATVTIRRMSYLQLEAAERAKAKQAMTAMASLAAVTSQMDGIGTAIAEAIRKRAETADPDPAAAAPVDPLDDYDLRTVLVSGLVAVKVDGAAKAEPFTDAMADDLEPDLAPLLAREILQLTRPALFQTAEEAQAAEKNA